MEKVKIKDIIIFVQLENDKIHQVLSSIENKRQAIHLIAQLGNTLIIREIPETFEIESDEK